VGAGFHMQALTKVSVWSTHAKTQRRWLAGPDRAKCWVSPLGTRNPWIARQSQLEPTIQSGSLKETCRVDSTHPTVCCRLRPLSAGMSSYIQ
jgi:hypothetical protein